MIFTSYPFFVFFISFFFLYWFGFNKKLRSQNVLLLAGSYFFYAWADWRFLFFLICVSAFNFSLGIYIEKSVTEKSRKWLLYLGLLQGLGGLAFFKYYNFFVVSISEAFGLMHVALNLQTLNIIIPLGISFFTFRTVSYLLDIEKGKLTATKDWVVFFNYVSFFPALLSGPIDKAKMFIPQLEKPRVFDYILASNGMQQILWGFFKKTVIANSCALITDEVFANYQTLPGSTLLLSAFFYTIQIYADFSGYSDMAIGFSKLLGFKITKNFDFPFFSQNIAEFWRKWHISLTAWLTEYVFAPLSIAFRDYGNLGLIMAIVINFILIGIWHGANWTYVLFGFLHGCYFIPLILNGTMNKKSKIVKDKKFLSIREIFNIMRTFLLVMFTFVIFKAATISQAFHYFAQLFSKSVFSVPVIDFSAAGLALLFSMVMLSIEWINRNEEHGLVIDRVTNVYKRWGIYLGIILALFFFGVFGENQFIYFQF